MDWTHDEAAAAFDALKREVGKKAEVYVALNADRAADKRLSCSLYPAGICNHNDRTHLMVYASNYALLYDLIREKWEEHADLYDANAIKAMALAIVRLTYELGECSEASLRAEFDAAEVRRFSERACERANAMAERGPFTVIRVGGANDQAEAA